MTTLRKAHVFCIFSGNNFFYHGNFTNFHRPTAITANTGEMVKTFQIIVDNFRFKISKEITTALGTFH